MRALLLVNALGCLLATLVLAALPSAIPAAIGITVPPDQYLIPRLLAASELAIATVCIAAIWQPSRDRVKLAAAVLVVFHAASIVASAPEFAAHGNIVVAANMAVRAAIILALLVLARRQRRSR